MEATGKPRGAFADSVVIPKRILYVDSEGWFITASDQYNDRDQLWKTLVTFHAYQDRPGPNARVAIWPFKRMFQTAMVDEDVTDGFSTVIYTPGHENHYDTLFINMSPITPNLFPPQTLAHA